MAEMGVTDSNLRPPWKELISLILAGVSWWSIHAVFCSYEARCMSSGLNEIPPLVVFWAHPVREETLWRLRAIQRDYTLYPICSVSLEAKWAIMFISYCELQHTYLFAAWQAFTPRAFYQFWVRNGKNRQQRGPCIKKAISRESPILTMSGQAVLAGSIFKCQHNPETRIV